MVLPTISAFAGGNSTTLLGPDSGQNNGTVITYSAAQRRAFLETDFDLNTGIINPSTATDGLSGTFSTPIKNTLGTNFVLFEIAPTVDQLADRFFISFNGGSFFEVAGTAYGKTNFTTNSETLDTRNAADNGSITAGTLNDLLTSNLRIQTNFIDQSVWGIGLDFSDYGVAADADVSSFTIRAFDASNRVDPVFIAGLIPEPSVALSSVLGLAMIALRRKR